MMPFTFWHLAIIFGLFPFLIHSTVAISYRCEGDQVLIVQSFGNDSIRMHCQRLQLCGHKSVRCQYDQGQSACGGKTNFVSHVSQPTPLAPVAHTCCELLQALPGVTSQAPTQPGIPGHDGNDCFVYELPDGSAPDSAKKEKTEKTKTVTTAEDEAEEFTLLNSVDQIPSQFGDSPTQIGYRMRLFLLRNKSPPVLLVKAIQRVKDGYRVTICRPRCGPLMSHGRPLGSREGGRGGKVDGGKSSEEWAAAAWSSWKTTSWSSWSTNILTPGNGTKRGGRSRNRSGGNGRSIEAEASAEAGAEGNAEARGGGNGGGQSPPSIMNNVTVIGVGGQGGDGGHAVGNANLKGGIGQGIGVLAVAVKNGTDDDGGKNGGGKGGGDEDEKGRGKKNGGGGRQHKGKKDDDESDDEDGSDDGDISDGDGGKVHGRKKGKGKAGKEGGDDGTDETKSDEDEDEDRKENGGDGKEPKGKKKGRKGNEDDRKGKKRKDKGGKTTDENGGNGGGDGNVDGSDEEEADSDEEKSKKSSEEGHGRKGNKGGRKGNKSKEGKKSNEELPSIQSKVPTPIKGKDGKERNAGGDGRKVKVDGGGNRSGGEESSESSKEEEANGKEGKNKSSDSAGGGSQEPKPTEGSVEEANNGTRMGGNEKVSGGKSAEEAEEKRRKEAKAKGRPDEVDRHGKEGNMTKPIEEGHFNRTKVDNRVGSGEGSGNAERNRTLVGENIIVSGGHKNRSEVIGSVEKGNVSEETETGKGKGTTEKAGKGKESEESEEDGGEARKTSIESKHHTKKSTKTSTTTTTTTTMTTTTTTSTTTPKATTTHGGGGDGGGHHTTTAKTITPGGGGGGVVPPQPLAGGVAPQPAALPAPQPAVGQPSPPAFVQQAETAPAPAAPPSPQPVSPAQAAAPQMDIGAMMQRSCFSADTIVHTAMGPIRMDQLEVGDMVLVPASGNTQKFERVEMFYHRQPDAYTMFLHIETETGKGLSLTPLHLFPFGNCTEMKSGQLDLEQMEYWMQRSRFAHKATVGQCVFTMDSGNRGGGIRIEQIKKIGRRYSRGIYSPITVEGALMTNGILASCFSQIESHAIQKLSFDILVYIYRAFGYLNDFAERATFYQEIPNLLDYFHIISRYIIPFAKY